MYKAYPGAFDAPPDEAKLWRYMSLARFLWMLKERKLYFSRVAQLFDDPYEATALSQAYRGRSCPDGGAGKLEYGIAGSFAAGLGTTGPNWGI